MIAGTRAKITDFGMSKLATVNPRMTALTLCPGNLLYMSPEALDEAKSYTAKLDIFSFGVIVIQILTRQFPNPTDRFHTVHVPQLNDEVRVLVPETERRQAHLQLIPDTHSLKPLVLQCLKKEMQRPSAIQLSERLSELKQAPQYTESMHQAQNSSEIQQLEQQLQSEIEAKTREASEHQAHSTQLQRMVEAKDRQLQENQHTIKQNQYAIETTETYLRQTQQLLLDSQQSLQQRDETISELQQSVQQRDETISELQQSLQQKHKTISELQQIVSHHQREIKTLHHLPVTEQETATAVSIAQKDISKMTWREGKKAPEGMVRGAAVVDGNTAYFRPANSVRVYSYQNIPGNKQWSRMPDNPNAAFSLAVIDGLLTSVGGSDINGPTNTLLSLTGEGERKQWSEVFPPMPTSRHSTACIAAQQALVVAGGSAHGYLDIVEVMDINIQKWTTVCPLPQKLRSSSGIFCGDSLYLAGGLIGPSETKSVLTCSLSDLWQPETSGSRPLSRIFRLFNRSNVWKEISSLPVMRSTLASFGGHLLAIGGEKNHTTDVYRYDSHTASWHVISQMKNRRSQCLAVTLPGDQLIVVGGWTKDTAQTDSVEILEDMHAIETKERELQHVQTQQQLRQLPPCIDPHNTRKYIPASFTPVATLSQCTHEGGYYRNDHNDFCMEIPAGAIPEGESITIDIGVALYGPFQYPEGLRPVSPVFWVCVRDQNDFQFSKPLKVTIPHCLNLESYDDIESLGLTFLKGDHELNPKQHYQFQQAAGYVRIEPLKRSGMFQTTHFCSLCISSKISRRAIQKAMFCVYAAIPRTMSPREPTYVYFFVTFLLSTCLKMLKKQISKIPELHGHISRTHIFQFSKHISNPALGIVLPESSAPGWTFGLQFTTEIQLSDIDFFVSGGNLKELLKIKEDVGMYPPRFNVVISCSPTAKHHMARFKFTGAEREIVFDIPLIPLPISSSLGSSTDPPIANDPKPLDIFHIMIELKEVAPRWKYIGIALGLHNHDLRTIAAEGKSVIDCLTDMVELWLNQNYDVGRHGEPSWQVLAEAVRQPVGGNNAALAQKISEIRTSM